MPTHQTRRSRRRVVAPSTLPRPTATDVPVEEILIETEPTETPRASTRPPGRRSLGVRAHHVVSDYSYIRPDLILVGAVSAVCLGFVVAMAFVL